MDGEEFRKGVEQGLKNYGTNRWYFLRELAQNSRDAGSSVIKVKAFYDRSRRETIIFEDNGTGMTLEHARKYLLTLYSSNKDKDRRSAGRYGIGFWSVLKYEPESIIIESCTKREKWGIIIDKNLNIRRIKPQINHTGTRIILSRPARFIDEKRLQSEVVKALKHYCKFLRRNDRKFSPLPVFFHGENITMPVRLNGPLSYCFKKNTVEGAVTLGEKPVVELYARGLKVWSGTSIHELSHTFRHLPLVNQVCDGLSPIFLLNGNMLNVNISRRAVIDDERLREVKKYAMEALSKLIKSYLEKAYPRSFLQKFFDFVSNTGQKFKSLPAVSVIIVFALITVLYFIITHFQENKIEESHFSGTEASFVLPSDYKGAVVEENSPYKSERIYVEYSPPEDLLFKIMTVERYDEHNGFVYLKPENLFKPDRGYRCLNNCLNIKVHLERGGKVFLPVPYGCQIDSTSIMFNGEHSGNFWITPQNDTIIFLPEKKGIVEYRCGRTSFASPDPAGSPAERNRLPGTDNVIFPDKINKILKKAETQNTDAKVLTAIALTDSLIKYDQSKETVRSYWAKSKSDRWLDFVLSTGKGDCDVINGLAVLFLRAMGVDSRLIIGIIGRDGKNFGTMHAWVEYYDNYWHQLDASTGIAGIKLSKKEKTPDFPQKPVNPHSSLLTKSEFSPYPGSPAALFSFSVEMDRFDEKFFKDINNDFRELTNDFQNARQNPELTKKIKFSFPFTLIFFISLLIIASLLFIYSITGSESWEQIEIRNTKSETDEVIARVLNAATAAPALWQNIPHLWTHNILPTVDNRRISLLRAIRLSRAKKLFCGSKGNELSEEAANSGSIVLDKESKIYRNFVSNFYSVCDLDDLAVINPVPPEKGSKIYNFFKRVNYFLAGTEAKNIRFFVSTSLKGVCIKEVDLSGLKINKNNLLRGKIVIINPEGEFFRNILNDFKENPAIAVFKFVMTIVTNSSFMHKYNERILYTVALNLLMEEMAKTNV